MFFSVLGITLQKLKKRKIDFIQNVWHEMGQNFVSKFSKFCKFRHLSAVTHALTLDKMAARVSKQSTHDFAIKNPVSQPFNNKNIRM
jgi:hypothetical protein